MDFNAPFLAAFGEDVKFKTPSRLLALRAIVEPDSNIEHLQQVKIDNQTLLLYIDDSDVAKKGIERRQEVTVRNQIYNIVEIGNDMNGMAVFRVAKV
jgi:hypothetical protein